MADLNEENIKDLKSVLGCLGAAFIAFGLVSMLILKLIL